MDTLEMAASMDLMPKEPAYERGVLARQTYLELARRVIGEPPKENYKMTEVFSIRSIRIDENIEILADSMATVVTQYQYLL